MAPDDATDDESTPHPRTRIADAVLDGTAAECDPEIDAVLDVSFSATEAACLSSHELLDWDEYREVAL